MNWPASCVKPQEPLAKHTSFRIGGPAEWYAEPSTMDELLSLLRAAQHSGIPVSVIGGGTNLLVADRGLRGLVLRVGRGFRQVDELSPPDAPEATIRCGASVLTQHVVSLAAQRGWEGLEAMTGLPGQIGGAVTMNAQNIGRFVDEVTLVSTMGHAARVGRGQLHFSYRYSAIGPGIIVEAKLRFRRAESPSNANRIHDALCYRNTTQDLRLPSAGCAFKNPQGESAGRLIDQAGLKGKRIGDAQVSLRHGNFIVNLGQATCDDVLGLMEHVQRRVRRSFGIGLEPEFRILGEPW